jgi:hypothetical protein
MRHIRLEHLEKSAVVEHSIGINTGHHIGFSSTSLFQKAAGYTDCLVNEAVGIQLNTRNLNRGGGFIRVGPSIL